MATLQQKEETYNRILKLFDMIDDMVKAIQDPEVVNSKQQLDIAEDFIVHITEATEAILATYLDYVKRGGPPTDQDSRAIENAARRIFIEIGEFISRAQQITPAA